MTGFIEKMLDCKGISVASGHLEKLDKRWQEMESMKQGLDKFKKAEEPMALVHIPSCGRQP